MNTREIILSHNGNATVLLLLTIEPCKVHLRFIPSLEVTLEPGPHIIIGNSTPEDRTDAAIIAKDCLSSNGIGSYEAI